MKTFSTILLSLASLTAVAQTDITGRLANPSFEADDITQLTADATRGAYTAPTVVGWTLAGKYGVSDIMTAQATATDNNFGRPGQPADGTQMYYLRNAWSASQATLQQQVTLPRGRYRLTVDNKCVTQSTHAAYLTAAGEQTNLTFQTSMPQAWATTSVEFETTEETAVTLGLTVDFGSGSGGSLLVDNFRLYDITSVPVTPDPTEDAVLSPTEGVITSAFVPEAEMKADLMQMLCDFTTYIVKDYKACAAPNSLGETCGCFMGENTMGGNEQGVRPNADLSMICAFLSKYGPTSGATLPEGITWAQLEDLAQKTLVFAYSTHKANRLKVCAGGSYWGSTSKDDHVWESSLWAMSVAYSAFFQWDRLTEAQRGYIYAMLKAECNYELERTIPTGYKGDTKAEENGWEADILAATLGLFPDDALAPQWFQRMREFAINSYSHPSDKQNQTVIDPERDDVTVAQLYKGQNLYDDYTLQNHNLFHTSYQNVVMQELGEAALALRLFQGEGAKWQTHALMHHNQEVQDSVLNWLALADGELAMPNGNDWSLFLYDQITSYTTQACFQRDANALMLENLAYKQIKARQKTTTDGSWLLRPDVGARRMGVEAHRVMMTYLMHDAFPTDDLVPTLWDDFNLRYAEARLLPCQNVVRAASKDRFTCFSWSDGLKSYTGYFAANSPDKNKIVVPYRANQTGNLTGWYEVDGRSTNAAPVVKGVYQLKGNSYAMNGEMNVNDKTLNNRFALYSTPGNALIYLDYVTALAPATITAEKGGLLAISTDELTKTQRTLYYGDDEIRHRQMDGSSLLTLATDWVNIDNQLAVIGHNSKRMAFGDRGANNSIFTSKLYPMYSREKRTVAAGERVDSRHLVYYSGVTAEQTQRLAQEVKALKPLVEGWNAVLAVDPDHTAYLLAANFKSATPEVSLGRLSTSLGAPVFALPTTVDEGGSTVTVSASENTCVAQAARLFVSEGTCEAHIEGDTATLLNAAAAPVTLCFSVIVEGQIVSGEARLEAGKEVKVSLVDGTFHVPSETTGIIQNSEFRIQNCYDLAGRRATKATRGLRIQGGRKIIK